LETGSDQIDNATAGNGQHYRELPVAFRYRSTVDSTCSCRAKDGQSSAIALLQDGTLRTGDLIMTTGGVRMLRGAHHLPYNANDFLGVAQSSLPREERDILMAMKP